VIDEATGVLSRLVETATQGVDDAVIEETGNKAAAR